MQNGKFDEALAGFQKILHCITLAVAQDADEEKELVALLQTATNYCIVLGMQLQKKGTERFCGGVLNKCKFSEVQSEEKSDDGVLHLGIYVWSSQKEHSTVFGGR